MYRSTPPPRSGVSEAQYKSRKAAAATPIFDGGGAVGLAPSFSVPDLGSIEPDTPGVIKSFAGLDETCAHVIPSDQALAVGPTTPFVVQVINSCITVMQMGVIQSGFPKTLNAFFKNAPASAFLGDPRAVYDARFSRFVVLADDFNTGIIYVAISQSSTPLGAWWLYSFTVPGSVSGDFPDFPTLGVDHDIVYIGSTLFHANNTFTSVVMFLPRGKMYAGQALGTWFYASNFTVGGVQVDTLQPAFSYKTP